MTKFEADQTEIKVVNNIKKQGCVFALVDKKDSNESYLRGTFTILSQCQQICYGGI